MKQPIDSVFFLLIPLFVSQCDSVFTLLMRFRIRSLQTAARLRTPVRLRVSREPREFVLHVLQLVENGEIVLDITHSTHPHRSLGRLRQELLHKPLGLLRQPLLLLLQLLLAEVRAEHIEHHIARRVRLQRQRVAVALRGVVAGSAQRRHDLRFTRRSHTHLHVLGRRHLEHGRHAVEAEVQRVRQLLLHLTVTHTTRPHRRQQTQQQLVRAALVRARRHQRRVLLHVQLAQPLDGRGDERVVVQRAVEQGTAQLCVTITAGIYAILVPADGTVGVHLAVGRVDLGGSVL